MRERITLEVELLEPRFQAVTIPEALRHALKLKAAADAANGGAPQQRSEIPLVKGTPFDAVRLAGPFIMSSQGRP